MNKFQVGDFVTCPRIPDKKDGEVTFVYTMGQLICGKGKIISVEHTPRGEPYYRVQWDFSSFPHLVQGSTINWGYKEEWLEPWEKEEKKKEETKKKWHFRDFKME